uniref:Uncharacterized protein n=1 Tax=Chenopodium quinoa TaxID=63459 RepID=A0A803NAD9_CHEQI
MTNLSNWKVDDNANRVPTGGMTKRFLELSETLRSGTTPKFDKAAILTDAIRQVKLLHEETCNLTSQNGEVKEKINELKAKKKALCAEKHRLVSEKEKLEQRINFVGSCPSLHFHPTSVPTSYAIPCQAVGGKLMPLINYSGVPFWQFVPQAAFDTHKIMSFTLPSLKLELYIIPSSQISHGP